MKIEFNLNGKPLNIYLKPTEIIAGEKIGFLVTRIDWEGKEGQVLDANSEAKAIMEYIDNASFVLPNHQI